jgi:protoheme IX farnesyltransferase
LSSLPSSPDPFKSIRVLNPATGEGVPVHDAPPLVDARGKPIPTSRGIAALIETTKPGITRLVTLTSAVGFAMTALARPWLSKGDLIIAAVGCLVGTALSSSGANTLNQVMERSRDAKMDRTRTRPLPSGRSHVLGTVYFGAACALAGLAVLWITCGFFAMFVSLLCLISYLAWYTPLKPATPIATFIGGIPGALPPIIGAVAASDRSGTQVFLEPAAWSLFTLMFVWQIPHFLAIAWMYRDDYEKGGYAVLPVVDKQGKITAMTVAFWTLALLPAALLPALAMKELLGWPYLIIAALSTIAFMSQSLKLIKTPDRDTAKRVFFGSIMHLPVLLLAMVAEAAIRRAMMQQP